MGAISKHSRQGVFGQPSTQYPNTPSNSNLGAISKHSRQGIRSKKHSHVTQAVAAKLKDLSVQGTTGK